MTRIMIVILPFLASLLLTDANVLNHSSNHGNITIGKISYGSSPDESGNNRNESEVKKKSEATGQEKSQGRVATTTVRNYPAVNGMGHVVNYGTVDKITNNYKF